VIFSNHALERARELRLPFSNPKAMRQIFLNAKKMDKCVRRELYKLTKYGSMQDKIAYWASKHFIFTVKEDGDKQIIITITDRALSTEFKARKNY